MSQKLKLYGFILCPYVLRVRFALENLKIKYDYHEIDLYKGKQREQAYLSINPLGKVPSIGYNNQIIYESLPLLEFIENEYGGVFPQDNMRKAQQRIWAGYFDQNFISKMWQMYEFFKADNKDGVKKLAKEQAEIIRFFTKNSELQQRVKQNKNTFFEGNQLSYVDYAIIPHFKYYLLMNELLFKQPFYELIENDELINTFNTYSSNVIATEAYNKITYKLNHNLPPLGQNSVLDSLAFTHETYNFEKFYETYLRLRFNKL